MTHLGRFGTEAEASAAEQSRLDAVTSYAILDTPADARFDRLTRLACTLLGTPMAILTLIDEHRQWFKSRVGIEIPETARAVAICNVTIAGEAVLVVEDTHTDPRFQNLPVVLESPHVRFYAGAPLRTADGFNVGTLAVIDDHPRKMDEAYHALLLDLAAIAVDELELWRRLGSTEERRRRELENRQTERTLNARRFAALVERAPDVILLVDEHGRIKYASPAVQRVTGWSPTELVGRNLFDRLVHPDDLPAIRSGMQQLADASDQPVSLAHRLHHRGGSWRLIEGTAQNLLTDPAVQAIVLNVRDVTERIAAEQADARTREELARAREQLNQAEKLEALGRLAGGIAHDFNNMLTVILNNVAAARERLALESPEAAELNHALAAAERAATLTRQILAFGRRQVLARGPASLNAVVEDALQLVRPLSGQGIQIETRLAPDLGTVRIDRAQMERVLLNLLFNARDAMPTGGTLTVSTHRVASLPEGLASSAPEQPAGPFVVLTVQDTGVGMTSAVLDRAFEPFFTTKAAGDGTGLGLSIVHGVVDQHDGFVQADSSPGLGSRFRIYLPETPDETPRAEPTQAQPVRAPDHRCVLVAEDDDLVRAVAVRLLRRAGYRVVEAADGLQAVELFTAGPDDFALVLLDSIMPKLGGAEARERIRQVRPDVPCLMVSGYPEPGVDGDQPWLAKPYTAETLLSHVRSLLPPLPAR